MIFLRIIFSIVISYLSYFFLTFIIVESFTIAFVVITNTSLEVSFLKIIALTLGIKESNYSIGVSDLALVFSIWSFVFMLLSKLLNIFFRVAISQKYILIALTVFHFLAIARMWRSDLTIVIAIFYILSLTCVLFYMSLKEINKLLEQRLK